MLDFGVTEAPASHSARIHHQDRGRDRGANHAEFQKTSKSPAQTLSSSARRSFRPRFASSPPEGAQPRIYRATLEFDVELLRGQGANEEVIGTEKFAVQLEGEVTTQLVPSEFDFELLGIENVPADQDGRFGQ